MWTQKVCPNNVAIKNNLRIRCIETFLNTRNYDFKKKLMPCHFISFIIHFTQKKFKLSHNILDQSHV
jgi:hypothetical protein